MVWIFDKLVKEGKKLTVTNPEMTRFFMSINNATELVWEALKEGQHGDLFVYKNKACTIKELADIFSDNQEVIGNRCEEKTDEALLTINELNHSIEYDNFIKVNKEIKNNYNFDRPITSDNAERLTKQELQEMLNDWRNNNENGCFK